MANKHSITLPFQMPSTSLGAIAGAGKAWCHVVQPNGFGLVLISIAILILGGTNTAFPQSYSVTGSEHDLSANASIVGGIGSCAFCHGAHTTEDELPLWKRTGTVSTFTLYDSDSLNAEVEQPGSLSLACLSCHDGLTAFDAVYGSTGTPGNNMNTIYPGSYAISGTELGDDHPIGISITADPDGIRDEASITNAGLKIYSGKVECSSCHDAHGIEGYDSFLRADNAGSELCLACHIK